MFLQRTDFLRHLVVEACEYLRLCVLSGEVVVAKKQETSASKHPSGSSRGPFAVRIDGSCGVVLYPINFYMFLKEFRFSKTFGRARDAYVMLV